MRAVAGIEFDDDDPPTRLQVAGDALEIRGAVLDVVQHVVEERDIDVACRERGIGELAPDGHDIRHALRFGLVADTREESFVQLHGINAPGRNGFCERKREEAGTGAEVGYDIAWFQLQPRNDLVGTEARNALGALECLDPLFGRGPRGKLRSCLVGENTREDRLLSATTQSSMQSHCYLGWGLARLRNLNSGAAK